MAEKPADWSRSFPAFSIAATITYFVVMGLGLSPFIYYPEIGRWSFDRLEDGGPPMFFYGWLAEATVAGLLAAGLAQIVPNGAQQTATRVALAGAGIVPFALTACILVFLRKFFW